MAWRTVAFMLEIEIGNDAMQSGAEIAAALRSVANEIESIRNPRPTDSRRIRDVNGNLVGGYNFKSDA